jgi:hypothetical protein
MPPRRIAGLSLFLGGVLIIVYGFLFSPDIVPLLLPLGVILTIIGVRLFLDIEIGKGRLQNLLTCTNATKSQ